MTKSEGCPEDACKAFKMTRSSNDSARCKSRKIAAQTSRKGTKPTLKFPLVKDLVLLVHPNGAGEHALTTSNETFKLVSSKADPIQSKIDLRGTGEI